MVSIMCIPFLKTTAVLYLRTDPKKLIKNVYKVLDLATTMFILVYTSQAKIIQYSRRRDLSRNYGLPKK